MKISAGLLMYKFKDNELKVFLVHPGGPFWRNKDSGAWSVPKGEITEGEKILDAAKREFEEELGIKPESKFISLGQIKQKSGKIVYAWGFEKDLPSEFLLKQNIIEVEYPYKSGKKIKIPEIDKAQFFSAEEAKKKINPAQIKFIEKLEEILQR